VAPLNSALGSLKTQAGCSWQTINEAENTSRLR
jgi:hypothetical protein